MEQLIKSPLDRAAYLKITNNTIPRITDQTLESLVIRDGSLSTLYAEGQLCSSCKLYPNNCNDLPAQRAKENQVLPSPDYRHL